MALELVAVTKLNSVTVFFPVVVVVVVWSKEAGSRPLATHRNQGTLSSCIGGWRAWDQRTCHMVGARRKVL